MTEDILNSLNVGLWAKDVACRYTYCNDHFAKAIGLNSPSDIIGKTDDCLELGKLDDYLDANEEITINRNSLESCSNLSLLKDVMITEVPVHDADNNRIGTVGSYINIAGKQLINKAGYYDKKTRRFYLGEDDFNNAYLGGREIDVFKKLLLGYSAREIGELMKISTKTVESYIGTIKLKFQAKSKGEIVATAIQFGFTHILTVNTFKS